MSEPLPETLNEAESAPVQSHPFRTAVIFSLVMIAASTAAAGWAFERLPADALVPTHWNVQGQIDGHAGRWSLFLMPGTLLGMTLLLFALPYIEPRRGNLLRSSRAYCATWMSVITLLAAIQGVSVLTALGHAVPMNTIAFGGAGAIFLVLGNFLGKVRSNFVFGVRTPWTLASDLSWNKTHRLAGRMFVACGAALIAATLLNFSGTVLVSILLGSVATVVIASMAYSYFVWRNDPQKATTG
jgi:uncharacterized membrane protein